MLENKGNFFHVSELLRDARVFKGLLLEQKIPDTNLEAHSVK